MRPIQASEEYSRKAVEALKAIRLEKGLSQQSLADLAGVSRSTVQHAESGLRNPTLIVCHALAAAMDVPLADVLKGIK